MQNTDTAMRSLDLLPALDALLTSASVTRAALKCGLSQPAMSRIVARLRLEFHDPLLVRVGSRWALTPRAEQLREPGAELLRGARELYDPDRFDPATATRAFRMAIPDVVGAALLPRLHEAFSQAARDCRLTIIPWPRSVDDAREIDLAIGSEARMFPAFRMERLFDDVDQVAYRCGDQPPPPEQQLLRHHVAVVPAGLTIDLVDDWLAQQGRSRRIVVVVPHYLQALHLVARSDLLAILPSRLIRSLGNTVGVAGADLAVPQQPDQHWLLWPPQLQSDPAVSWLRAIVHSVV